VDQQRRPIKSEQNEREKSPNIENQNIASKQGKK